MRISATPSGDHTLCRVHCARLDASVAEELTASLKETLDSVPGRARIDLAEVLFIDSSALGALVGALVPRAHDVTLVGVRPTVRIVFRLTRVDSALAIAE